MASEAQTLDRGARAHAGDRMFARIAVSAYYRVLMTLTSPPASGFRMTSSRALDSIFAGTAGFAGFGG
jgi:hypothetical protein